MGNFPMNLVFFLNKNIYILRVILICVLRLHLLNNTLMSFFFNFIFLNIIYNFVNSTIRSLNESTLISPTQLMSSKD